MKNSDLIWAFSELDEDLVLAAKERKFMKKNHKRPLKMALIAAAIIVLLTGTVVGMYYTRITATMEDTWNTRAETEMTQEQKDFVEAHSADIGESVTDQGITVTIDSVTCAEDTVYLMISYGLDETMYDLSKVVDCNDHFSNVYVENDTFGTVESSGGGGSGEFKDSIYWTNGHIEFRDLPDDANLSDGATVLNYEMSQILIMVDGEEEPVFVEGTWNFSFELPEHETSDSVVVEQEMTFDCGVTLLVREIAVSEDCVSFTVETETDEYYFVDSEMAELARAAEPDLLQFTVDAELEDGTVVPCTGGHMTLNEETGLDEWSISWAAPLDPETVKCLIFGDGNSAIWVDVK